MGADVLAEGFVFGTALAALLVTYTISSKVEAEKVSAVLDARFRCGSSNCGGAGLCVSGSVCRKRV